MPQHCCWGRTFRLYFAVYWFSLPQARCDDPVELYLPHVWTFCCPEACLGVYAGKTRVQGSPQGLVEDQGEGLGSHGQCCERVEDILWNHASAQPCQCLYIGGKLYLEKKLFWNWHPDNLYPKPTCLLVIYFKSLGAAMHHNAGKVIGAYWWSRRRWGSRIQRWVAWGCGQEKYEQVGWFRGQQLLPCGNFVRSQVQLKTSTFWSDYDTVHLGIRTRFSCKRKLARQREHFSTPLWKLSTSP